MLFLAPAGLVYIFFMSYKYIKPHMATELVDKLIGKRIHDISDWDRANIDDIRLSRFAGIVINVLGFCFVFICIGVHLYRLEIVIIAYILIALIALVFRYFIIAHVIYGKFFRKK
ncbi:MAG: hypothetical protein FWF81_11355 [Defluviitaleaceae bacterium]|nr:hypothetical protein [Defluviitaleaceae bacterium]